MAAITIRRLDESVKARLRVRAAQHGHSMEEEARLILQHGLAKREAERNLAEEIRGIIEPLGGVDLDPLPREPMRKPSGVFAAPKRRTKRSRG